MIFYFQSDVFLWVNFGILFMFYFGHFSKGLEKINSAAFFLRSNVRLTRLNSTIICQHCSRITLTPKQRNILRVEGDLIG